MDSNTLGATKPCHDGGIVSSTPRRMMLNGSGWLYLIRGGKRSEIQMLAEQLGLVLQARYAAQERETDYHGGW